MTDQTPITATLRGKKRGPERGPSFIFLGSSRAGSSWFFEVLREHPQIFVPPNKGTQFFSDYYDLGRDWYEAFFPARTDGRIVGEVCEHYLSSAEALARIREYRSHMRLICCFRNPYERALSAWRFRIRNGVGERSLSAEGAQRPDIFSNGYSATQLTAIRRLFPAEHVLVIAYDDLGTSALTVVRRLYEFVGASLDFVPSSIHRRINGNARPRSRLLARAVHNLHMRSWGPSRWASNTIGTIKRFHPLRQLVTSLLYEEIPQSIDWPEYLGEFPDSVISRYEEEISALEHMLGRNLSHWRASADVGRRTRPEMDLAAPQVSSERRPPESAGLTGPEPWYARVQIRSARRPEARPLRAIHGAPTPNNGQSRYNWPWTR